MPGQDKAATVGAGLLHALGIKPATAERWAPILAAALAAQGIAAPRQVAAFLANAAHETGGFERLVESLNYSVEGLLKTFGRHRIGEEQAARLGRVDQPPAKRRPAQQEAIANIVYGGEWGRRNLGNTKPGDGWAFRGRGVFQITGRANYERFGLAIGKSAEEVAELLADPHRAAASAADFFVRNDIGRLADRDDIRAVRIAVNGGTLGMAEVAEHYRAAKAFLGAA